MRYLLFLLCFVAVSCNLILPRSFDPSRPFQELKKLIAKAKLKPELEAYQFVLQALAQAPDWMAMGRRYTPEEIQRKKDETLKLIWEDLWLEAGFKEIPKDRSYEKDLKFQKEWGPFFEERSGGRNMREGKSRRLLHKIYGQEGEVDFTRGPNNLLWRIDFWEVVPNRDASAILKFLEEADFRIKVKGHTTATLCLQRSSERSYWCAVEVKVMLLPTRESRNLALVLNLLEDPLFEGTPWFAPDFAPWGVE